MDAIAIMMIAMAKAIWVFWDLLFEYSMEDRVEKLTLLPRKLMTPKVPIDFEKVRMTAESMAGRTSGKVMRRRIVALPAPSTPPISSSSELIELRAAETSR